jgi:ferredoxin
VQCGTCVDLCPEQALQLVPGLVLDTVFFKKTLLARAEPVKCRQCGKVFGTRQSLAKVMAVLAQKNILDSEEDLLNYCDTCRVVQLFESKDR